MYYNIHVSHSYIEYDNMLYRLYFEKILYKFSYSYDDRNIMIIIIYKFYYMFKI